MSSIDVLLHPFALQANHRDCLAHRRQRILSVSDRLDAFRPAYRTDFPAMVLSEITKVAGDVVRNLDFRGDLLFGAGRSAAVGRSVRAAQIVSLPIGPSVVSAISAFATRVAEIGCRSR